MLTDWIKLCELLSAHGAEFLIGKRELIKNKRAVGRLQDLADVEQLELLDEP